VILAPQPGEELLAEQVVVCPGELRLLLDLVEPLQAVVQELGQGQAGQPPDVLVRALLQEGSSPGVCAGTSRAPGGIRN
jgi:hypothetical protein